MDAGSASPGGGSRVVVDVAHAAGIQGAGWLEGLSWPVLLAVVAGLALLESAALIGLVVPGETTVVTGSALAATAGGPLALFLPVVALAVVAGDLVAFLLGRWWSGPLRRSALGRRVGPHRWARAEDLVDRYGGRAVLAGRFLPVAQALVPLLAGATGLPRRRFLLASAVGGSAWAGLYVTVGFTVGDAAEATDAPVGLAVGAVVVGVLVVSGAVTSVARRLLPDRRSAGAPAPGR